MELIHFVTVIINATSEIFKKIYYISNGEDICGN